MKLTRQELEDIWENKPYGYFAKMVKDLKGKKKYVVTTVAKKEVVVDTEVQTVWAMFSRFTWWQMPVPGGTA